VPTPLRQLVAFRRVRLRKGQTRTLAFRVRRRQLAAFDDEGRPFVAPGTYRISVGGGQPDDPASGAVSTTLVVTSGGPIR
jgi:beta-glucosidase